MEAAIQQTPKTFADVKPDLTYTVLPLSRVQVRGTASEKEHRLLAEVNIRDEWYKVSERFWVSIFARFGFAGSIFKYFRHQEVFDRIASAHPDADIRFCLDKKSRTALATSSPKRPVINTEDLGRILSQYDSSDLTYCDGMISSRHAPPSGEGTVKIGPDDFKYAFVMETPLDGYGEPNVYLSMLRVLCANGIIGYSKSFRSSIELGDDPLHNISRTLDSFDSDEGYSALRNRLEMAQNSPASLFECRELFRLVQKLPERKSGNAIMKGYDEAVGDVYGDFGVASLDGISDKKLRLLPAKCKVYDLLNLASEASSHRLAGKDRIRFQAYVGTIISREYDLEGAGLSSTKEFADFFIKDKKPN
jgi:hypothetical protein